MCIFYKSKSDILLEDDTEKREKMSEESEEIILKNLISIRKGRNFKRNKSVKNKYHINKRKTFWKKSKNRIFIKCGQNSYIYKVNKKKE